MSVTNDIKHSIVCIYCKKCYSQPFLNTIKQQAEALFRVLLQYKAHTENWPTLILKETVKAIQAPKSNIGVFKTLSALNK
jgi:hypothetical protein